jgi:pimeloyl-ACP methyl ester carboxylesterase
VVVDAVRVAGHYYSFALYRSPTDFNRGGDELAKVRSATLSVSYVSTTNAASCRRQIAFDIARPPLIVVSDMWWGCFNWMGSGLTNPDAPASAVFTVTCAEYEATRSKGLTNLENRRAIPDAIARALDQLRAGSVAATQVDVVGHGMGGLLARLYIDEPSYSRFDNFNAGEIKRLITMNTPHLGARMADEIVSFRDFTKQRSPQQWTISSAGLQELGIRIDPAEGDVVLDEMGPSSPVINGIGQQGVAAGTVHYHALVSTGGPAIARGIGLGLLPTGSRLLYISMEQLSARTFQHGQVDKMNLIFGVHSSIFCGDDHDVFATTWEQQGGLADQFTTRFPVTAGNLSSGHFHVQFDQAHTDRVIALLNSPVDGGLFAPSMPPPATVPRVNSCPM